MYKPGKHLLDVGRDPFPALVTGLAASLFPLGWHKLLRLPRLLPALESSVGHHRYQLPADDFRHLVSATAFLPMGLQQYCEEPRRQPHKLLARHTQLNPRECDIAVPELLPPGYWFAGSGGPLGTSVSGAGMFKFHAFITADRTTPLFLNVIRLLAVSKSVSG